MEEEQGWPADNQPDMSPGELSDYRRSWLVDKSKALNVVEETAEQKMQKRLKNKGAWLTAAQIAKEENKDVDKLGKLLAGLPNRSSRHGHCADDPDYHEYWYKYANVHQKDSSREQGLKVKSTVYSNDQEMMDDIHEDLGVGDGFDLDLDMASPSKAHAKAKAKSKAKAKAKPQAQPKPSGQQPPGSSTGGPTGESDDKYNTSMEKLEVAGENLLKQARAMLQELDGMLAAKPHFKGQLG